ncbi:MAG TPA: protein-glutamate O-methyltransferase CheR [Gammaproteobacteria bacterium]|nr:protein-glutamate O-methyltransferase CheR [Gammaproteobacteria bacterium]
MADSAEKAADMAGGAYRAGRIPRMEGRQFRDWAALLEHRAGLFIAPERRPFLESALWRRMRENGHGDYSGYYRHLRTADRGGCEWSALIDQVTVHETSFFRHRSSMRLVAEKLLPEAARRRSEFSIWSAACATGEECYSLAMLAGRFCDEFEGEFSCQLYGSDISLGVLEQARRGRYLKRWLDDIDVQLRDRYCRQVSDHHFEIVPELRDSVRFSPINLRDMQGVPRRSFDLIYCQNLLIYYGREVRLQIADLLADHLEPGGVLILGPGELAGWRHPAMTRLRYDDTLAYQRAY